MPFKGLHLDNDDDDDDDDKMFVRLFRAKMFKI